MVSTLARASLDGAIVVAAIWVLARVLRLTPATRTILWWCAAAKFVIALAWTTPVVIPILPATTPAAGLAAVTTAPPASALDRPRSDARYPRAAQAPARNVRGALEEVLREWSSFAAIGWTLGVGIVAVVGLRRWKDTARLRDESVPAPDAVQAQAIELASHLRLRRVPEIRLSRLVASPLVTGLLRPVVVLPSDRFNDLSVRQQQMALCHELVHVKRADLWLGCVPALAERVFFFHPLVHVASREYALAREAACDAAVMEALDAAPQEYGRLLLSLGVSPPQAALTVAGAASSFLNLKRRIAMLQDVSTRSTRSRVIAAGAVSLTLAAMVPMQLAARPPVAGANRAETADTAEQAGRAAGGEEYQEPAAGVPPELDAPAPEERQQTGARESTFVLLLGDDQRITSGSKDDVVRAERQQRNGEPLLWILSDGREYVIRDPELLQQARGVWADADDWRHLASGAHRALRHRSEAEELMKHAEIMKHVEAARQDGMRAAREMLGEQQKSIAEQVERDAHLRSLTAEYAAHALTDARQAMSGIDLDKVEQHLQSLKERLPEINEKMRELEHRLDVDVKGQLHELQLRLHELDLPGPEALEPLESLQHHFETLAPTVERASRRAADRLKEMRALIDRAIARGLAEVIR